MQSSSPMALNSAKTAEVSLSGCQGFAIFPFHANPYNGVFQKISTFPGVALAFPVTARVRFAGGAEIPVRVMGPDLLWFGRTISSVAIESSNPFDAANLPGQTFIAYGFSSPDEWLSVNFSPEVPRHRGVIRTIGAGQAQASGANDPVSLADANGALGADLAGRRRLKLIIDCSNPPAQGNFLGAGTVDLWHYSLTQFTAGQNPWCPIAGMSFAVPATAAGVSRVCFPDIDLNLDIGRVYANVNQVTTSTGDAVKPIYEVS